jgi:hypothetical protein
LSAEIAAQKQIAVNELTGLTATMTAAAFVATIASNSSPASVLEWNPAKSKTFVDNVPLAGSLSIPVGASSLNASVAGNLTSTLQVSYSITVGLDWVNGIYVREGDILTVNESAIGSFSGTAVVPGLASVSVSTTNAGLSLTGVTQLDDGDAVHNERIFLCNDGLSNYLPSAEELLPSGTFSLGNYSLSATIPALAGLLPPFTVTGTGNLNLTTGAWNVSFTQDAMLNGLSQWVFAGMGQLASQAASLTKLVEKLPLIGGDLAPALQSSLQSGFTFAGATQNVQSYLQSLGFTVLSVANIELLLIVRFGSI